MKTMLKNILKFICIVLVGMGIIGQINNSLAASVTTLKDSVTGNTNWNSSYTYTTTIIDGSKTLWNNVYCMKHHGSLKGGNKVTGNTEIYSYYSNNSEMQWLYDNMYIYNTTTMTNPELELCKTTYRLNLADIIEKYDSSLKGTTIIDKLSDGDIFRAQQFVFWHYTNGKNGEDNLSGNTLILYNALVSMANKMKEAGYVSPNKDSAKITTTIDKNSAVLDKEKQLIGPFTITGNDSRVLISFNTSTVSINNGVEENLRPTIVDANGTEIALNGSSDSAAYNGQFYIKYNNENLKNSISSNNDIDRVLYNININYSIQGFRTFGEYWKNGSLQPLGTIDRKIYTFSDTLPFTYNNSTADFALKKVITKVGNTEVTKANGFNVDRKSAKENNIDISILPLINTTNAKYTMNKTPVEVKLGDIVNYEIRVYNEGNVDGKVTEIADYIPVGMKVKEVYYKNNEKLSAYTKEEATAGNYSTENYYIYDETNGVLTVMLNNIKNIAAFNGTELFGDYITVKCSVENNAKGVLTNVAEIMRYTTTDGTTDRDSIPGNWTAPIVVGNKLTADKSADAWRNYANAQQNKLDGNWFDVKSQGVDDDDFEKVVVKDADLALKKMITNVTSAGTSQTIDRKNAWESIVINKTPLIVGYTNAEYTLNKTPVQVELGDEVTYSIAVFNEGEINGRANVISDYIPAGMTVTGVYYKNETTALTTNNTQGKYYTYDETNGVLTVYLNDTQMLAAFNGTDLAYDYITVKCSVDNDATGVLTNAAEIVGYVTTNGATDRDSEEDNWISPNGDDKKTSDKSTTEWKNFANNQNAKIDGEWHIFVGQDGDDDDDFEKVEVGVQKFDVALRKTISQVTNEEGTTTYTETYGKDYDENIETRIQKRDITVDNDSWSGFHAGVKNASTLKYYHAKDAVEVQKGDIITYVMEVYNEGTINGKVKEVTDYLPAGLVLAPNSAVNTTMGWSYVTGYGESELATNGYCAIKTTAMENLILDKIDETSKNVDSMQITLQCLVTDTASTNTFMTNIAEITKSVAVNTENEEIPTMQDIDSTVNNKFTGKNVTEIASEISTYYNTYSNHGVADLILTYFAGSEDEDDFETVYVKEEKQYSYNLKLIKIDNYTKETLNGIKFNVTGKSAGIGNIVVDGTTLDNAEYTTGTATEAVTYKGKTYQDGIIELNNIPLSMNEWFTTYTFEETEMPSTYKYDMVTAKLKLIFRTDEENEYGNITPLSLTDISTNAKLDLEYIPETNTVVALLPNNPKGDYDLYVTKTKENRDRIGEYVRYKVIYPTGEIKYFDATTGQSKIAEDIDITEEGTDLYKVQEVIAPTMYALDNSVIDITVNKYYDAETNTFKSTIESVVNESDSEKEYYYNIMGNDLEVEIPNSRMTGNYQIQFKKVDADDNTKVMGGVIFEVHGGPMGQAVNHKLTTDSVTGLTDKVTVAIGNDKYSGIYSRDTIWISEIDLGEYKGEYSKLAEALPIYIRKGLGVGKYVATGVSFDLDKQTYIKEVELESGEKVKVKASIVNNVVTVTVANKKNTFDLSLEKFITGVKTGDVETAITDREPHFEKTEVTNGDGYIYTPAYEDLKPVEVMNKDIVTYTLRIYNEGGKNGYASEIMDDIPEGTEFVPYTEGDGSINDQYRWILYREVKEGEELGDDEITREYNGKTYVVTTDVSKANYIVSDYLSKEQGEARMAETDTENPNLLVAFDEETMEQPDFRDVKIQFKVTYIAKTIKDTERTIINYAQITDDTDENGNQVTDIDSTPNEWVNGEDDQDREKIKVKYFDLSLVKWVSEAIVIEDGQENVHEGNKLEELANPDDHRLIYALYPETIGDYNDLEPVVKVDLPKSKLDNTVVKFKYVIKVANEGEIAGSVEEISDYVPEGLKFVAEDNPEWEEVEGKIVTDQLSGQILQPGESREVTVILTWINSESNLGLKVNVAEISEDYNESDTPDVDSTPNNFVVGEDDIDDAPVLLSIRTGENGLDKTYIILGLSVVCLIASGTILIKKFILNN